jgi:hypothetical protein
MPEDVSDKEIKNQSAIGLIKYIFKGCRFHSPTETVEILLPADAKDRESEHLLLKAETRHQIRLSLDSGLLLRSNCAELTAWLCGMIPAICRELFHSSSPSYQL